MQIFSSAMSRNEFSTNSMSQYQNFSADTSMTVSAPLHVADPSSTDSSNLSILFILLSNLPGKFPLLALLFSTSTFLSKTMDTSVHYKPTDSHSYFLHSSSHPPHVKNSIPYSQFLRLRRLCSDDTDFSAKADEMRNFFAERHRCSGTCPQHQPRNCPEAVRIQVRRQNPTDHHLSSQQSSGQRHNS